MKTFTSVRWTSFFLAILILTIGMALPQGRRAPAAQASVERGSTSFDREAARQLRQQVHSWLTSELAREGLDVPVVIPVSEQEKAGIDFPEQPERPVRVGLTKGVQAHIGFEDLRQNRLPRGTQLREFGAMRPTEDGGYVFSMALSSPDAAALRVHFTNFWLPAVAELYLYTEDGQVFGPYTGNGPLGDGDFWSHTVVGDEVILQLRHQGPVTDQDLEDTWFVISELGHIRPKFLSGFCSFNASCVENAACVSEGAVTEARDAVAHMQWIAGAFIYMCSGGLIADTDSSTDIPYFLTANHCISRGKDARNLENFFQFAKTSCDDTVCGDIFDTRANHPQSLRTLGSTIKATNRTADYTLLELREAAPAGSVFLGWNSSPVANSDGDHLYRISHPGGAPQAFSEHVVDTSKGTCSSWPRGPWIYSNDVAGATEGGSSGSPVVNAAGQVVGQLSGGCGTNVTDQCDSVNNATVDGAFASYFGEVSPFLDSGSSCSPVPEVCDNGADDDCDGSVDCSDLDCSGDPACQGGVCAASKDSCDSNEDCCSGNCKRGACKGN